MIPKKILFCTDFSENSEPARQMALDYAKSFGARLLVLHVLNAAYLRYPSLEDLPLSEVHLQNVETRLSESLQAMAEDCRKQVTEVTTFLREGIPANEIASLADEQDVDLIVMGTHGWTGLSHFLVGSTAENVLRNAHRPVLTVWTCKPQCQ